MSDAHTTYDVAIVGAGMAGATLACALGDSGLRVALIDRARPPLSWKDAGHDLRVSAISHASQRIFETLDVWSRMQARRISPYREMEVWDAGGQGRIHFDSADLGEPVLGHIIENRVTVAGLHERLAELPVEVLAPVSLHRLSWDADYMYLEQDDGQRLAARLVVGADGGRSWVRDRAGIAVRGWDYDQRALVTTVRPAESHQETAWQRFLPAGPLAFLPLLDNHCSIVWSTGNEHSEALLAMSEEAFAQELEAAFESRLGRIEWVGPRAALPLRFLHANAYVRPRLALIGDAAHTIHPLAGQGINLGLTDAAALAEVISEAAAARQNIGSIAVLRRYERWRNADNLAMLAAMDGFKRLFGSELSPVRWARNLGLNITHTVLPIKHLLMRQAIGISGEMPKLSRGIPLRS